MIYDSRLGVSRIVCHELFSEMDKFPVLVDICLLRRGSGGYDIMESPSPTILCSLLLPHLFFVSQFDVETGDSHPGRVLKHI